MSADDSGARGRQADETAHMTPEERLLAAIFGQPCSGAADCPAPVHQHGCFADLDGSACTDPGDHAADAAPDTTVRLTQREFDALLDYSGSLPTGTTIGKQWKRRNDYHDETKGWRRGEYVAHPNPDLVGIEWRDIEVVTPPGAQTNA